MNDCMKTVHGHIKPYMRAVFHSRWHQEAPTCEKKGIGYQPVNLSDFKFGRLLSQEWVNQHKHEILIIRNSLLSKCYASGQFTRKLCDGKICL